MPEDTYIGEIKMFAGAYAPEGWAFCNGQRIPINELSALYNLIGTTYGGDGMTYFNLPDLQCRVPVHFTSAGDYQPGQPGGAQEVTLDTPNLPAHSHLVAVSDTGGSDMPKGNTWGRATDAVYANPNGSMVAMSRAGISATGGGKSHNNQIPYLALSFIISLTGIYPPRPEAFKVV